MNHIARLDKGCIGTAGSLGVDTEVAIGAGLSAKYLENGRIVYCYNGDGTHSASCALCGYSGEAVPHTYGGYIDAGDGQNHSRTCACGATETEVHRFVDDECEVCGYARGLVTNLTFTWSGTDGGFEYSFTAVWSGDAMPDSVEVAFTVGGASGAATLTPSGGGYEGRCTVAESGDPSIERITIHIGGYSYDQDQLPG